MGRTPGRMKEWKAPRDGPTAHELLYAALEPHNKSLATGNLTAYPSRDMRVGIAIDLLVCWAAVLLALVGVDPRGIPP